MKKFWDEEIVPALVEYIRIPAKSPHFDRDWHRNGHIEAAVQLARRWCEAHPLRGMRLEVVRLEGRTPLLLVEVAEELRIVQRLFVGRDFRFQPFDLGRKTVEVSLVLVG